MSRAWIVAAAVVVAVGLSATASATRSLTIYAVATKGQYANHADDRTRGALTNPFNADANNPTSNGKASRAGDNALIALKLYSDASFKNQIGSATYSCTFTVARVALCAADFELDNGAMTASGPTNFEATTFTLAVSGGTGKYLGSRGQVSSVPVGKGHRLTFILR
jgi:hypothetical protein